MISAVKRLALPSGEPAGIGPDLIIALAHQAQPAQLVYIGDVDMLRARAAQQGLALQFNPVDFTTEPTPHKPGQLSYCHITTSVDVVPGQLNPANSGYVLDVLNQAAAFCQQGLTQALVTPPVHKGVINAAGFTFSGHTEFLQAYFHQPQVVMLMANKQMKVALATTHLPLTKVSAAITHDHLIRLITTLQHSLKIQFGLTQPRIRVCGLNPHAGEQGHLGREELEVIIPCLEHLRQQGFNLEGPVAADTAFLPENLHDCDVILAMYHDQGLAAIKYANFAETVNITLGLPIIRTSVDHGTALSLAGSQKADTRSLQSAIQWAVQLIAHAENTRI